MNRSAIVFRDENSAATTRQRRVGCQPGATPRGSVPRTCTALKGRRNPAPFQGAPFDSQTQGVALGLHPAALSAPQPRPRKSEFTSFDASCPFTRPLLVTLNCCARKSDFQSSKTRPGSISTANRRPGPCKVARDSDTRCLAPAPK